MIIWQKRVGKGRMEQKITYVIHTVRNIIADLVYPRRCPVCDEIVEMPAFICKECRNKILYIEEPVCKKCGKPLEDERAEYCFDCNRKKHEFDAGRALFVYQGDIKKSLYRYKYSNKREYAKAYGEETVRVCGDWIESLMIDAIIPVPLHKSRKRKRGYNQAELYAREIGNKLNIPVMANLVTRTVNTQPQKELNVKERKNNLKKAFKIQQNIVQLNNILLVDDIYTTGNTMDAVACELRNAGIQNIYILCISIGEGF